MTRFPNLSAWFTYQALLMFTWDDVYTIEQSRPSHSWLTSVYQSAWSVR